MILGFTALERVVVAAYSYHSPQTPLRKSKRLRMTIFEGPPFADIHGRGSIPLTTDLSTPYSTYLGEDISPSSSLGLIKRSVIARAVAADRNAVHVTGNRCATEPVRYDVDTSLS